MSKRSGIDLEQLRTDIRASAAALDVDLLELREAARPRNIVMREFESGRLVTGAIVVVGGIALWVAVHRWRSRRARR